ncbi:DUF4326 domain-containing protein [Bradyrhizobium sp. HKCCYLR1051]|uniref:DUF4326 domain-containing protein n=1 Tax=Bradyrhizobium sp. HKCCYLR1051 TaxID=3420738 RepID=UPI003EB82839
MTERPRRIQRQRTKGWRMPENTVVVDRSTKWGNPFRVGPECSALSPANQVQKLRDMIAIHGGFYSARDQDLGKPKVTPADIRRELRGKNLACWCRLDQACHADLLLEIANAPEAVSP